ncbi:DUF6884 domain-containing protein [Streptomyces polygonati]|uniref:DUF6884 domain-containing protein n=1 Tax=Streptomyces polygonati TaxID=1617087 RepID=A0ABV8HRB6_9ACTN
MIISRGSKKAEPSWEEFGYRDVIPAGQLYTGTYHKSLRRAADALTDQSLIRIMSARHGLVTLERPLHPYDTQLGDMDAITPEQMARHTAALDLDDAHVIFLGGRDYAELLRQTLPHTLVPLTSGLGDQRAQCHTLSQSTELVRVWWQAAARLADHPRGTLAKDEPAQARVSLPPSTGPCPPATGAGGRSRG